MTQGEWISENPIIYILTGLLEGSYNYTILLYNQDGLSTRDVLKVSVIPNLLILQILSPRNISLNQKEIWLNFSTDLETDWIGFSLDSLPNTTITANILLNNLSEGTHFIQMFANDTEGIMVYSQIIWFSIDLTPPIIVLNSPQNSTYTIGRIWLNFSINEPFDWVAYSLDNTPNITIVQNTLLIDLSNGVHTLVLFANDSAGNSASVSVTFIIESVNSTTSTTSTTTTTTISLSAFGWKYGFVLFALIFIFFRRPKNQY